MGVIKMLEYIVNKKMLAGLALVAGTMFATVGCENCEAEYGPAAKGLYTEKIDFSPEENGYQQQSGSKNLGTKAAEDDNDGCPSGCNSISDTCCWCP